MPHATFLQHLLELLDGHQCWQERMETEVSKLTEAVSALQTAVADLKTRSDHKEAALQTDLDAANAEAAAAADQLAAITASISNVDVVPPLAFPDVNQPGS